VPGWDQKLALAKLRGHWQRIPVWRTRFNETTRRERHWQTRFLEVQPDDHARLNLVVAGRTAVLQLL